MFNISNRESLEEVSGKIELFRDSLWRDNSRLRFGSGRRLRLRSLFDSLFGSFTIRLLFTTTAFSAEKTNGSIIEGHGLGSCHSCCLLDTSVLERFKESTGNHL